MDNDKLQLIIEAAIAKAQSEKKIKSQVKEIQKEINALELDVKVSDSDVKSSIAKVNKMVKEGSTANIKARQEELRNQKLAFQEEQLLIRKQITDKQNSAKISKQSINEEITNRKQAIQMQKLQTQEEQLRQKELLKTAKLQQSSTNLKYNKNILDNQITTYLKQNSKLTDGLKSKLISIQTELRKVDTVNLNDLKKQFQSLKSEATSFGVTGQTPIEKFKGDLKNFATFLGAGTLIMSAINGLREIISNVEDVNSSMISLKKVTSETDATYNKFLVNTAQKAKELGASISDLIESTANFARLGYNLPDASKLAEVATLYKNVGDGINIDESTESIISTLKAFNIQASDSITIIDKFNEVGKLCAQVA